MSEVSPYELVLSRLGSRVVERGSGSALCRCPAHDDNNPSMRVFEDASGNVGVKCWSRDCGTEAICKAIGLEPRDLFARRPQHRDKFKNPTTKRPEFVGDVHRYVNEQGEYLFEKLKMFDSETCRKPEQDAHRIRIAVGGDGYRYSMKEGWYRHKGTSWLRIQTKNGKDTPPEEGAEWLEAIHPVLYFAYEVRLARESQSVLYWCEGEKDAQNVRQQWHLNQEQPRFYATTTFDGGNGRWYSEYIPAVRGVKEIVIVCDHDQTGYARGEFLRKRFRQARIKHRVVRPLEGKDVTDHLAAGYTLDQLVECDPAEELRLIQSSLPPGKQPKRTAEFGDWRPPLNEIELAQVFVQEYGEDVRWCPPYNKWYAWGGRHWQADELGDATLTRYIPLAKAVQSRAIGDDAKRLAEKAQTARCFQNVEFLVRRFEGLQVKATDLDADPHILPVANGLIDLETGKITPHERSRFVTDIVPLEYDPDAKCPVFENFLSQSVAEDQDLLRYIHRAFGYSLSRTAREQKFFFVYGPPRSGKSRLFQALELILPDPMSRVLEREHVMVRRFPSTSTEHLARLRPCRVVTVKEVMGKDRFDESLIKKLVGEDIISARMLYQQAVDYEAKFKLWVQGNERPEVTDQTGAVWERLRVIPFAHTVPADRRDIELPAKIRAEAQGILAWAVRGAIEYFANGLGTAEVIEAATAEYQEQADPVQDFTIAHVRVTPPEDRARMTIANTTTATALYEAYCSYCKSVRAKTVTLTTFGTRMEQRGYEKRRTNHGYVYWVTLANLEGEPKEDIVELLDNGEPDPWD